jgi:hypothetical protein
MSSSLSRLSFSTTSNGGGGGSGSGTCGGVSKPDGDPAAATTEPHSSADNSGLLEPISRELRCSDGVSPLALSPATPTALHVFADGMPDSESPDPPESDSTAGSSKVATSTGGTHAHRRRHSGSESKVRVITVQSPKVASPLWRRRMEKKALAA